MFKFELDKKLPTWKPKVTVYTQTTITGVRMSKHERVSKNKPINNQAAEWCPREIAVMGIVVNKKASKNLFSILFFFPRLSLLEFLLLDTPK